MRLSDWDLFGFSFGNVMRGLQAGEESHDFKLIGKVCVCVGFVSTRVAFFPNASNDTPVGGGTSSTFLCPDWHRCAAVWRSSS